MWLSCCVCLCVPLPNLLPIEWLLRALTRVACPCSGGRAARRGQRRRWRLGAGGSRFGGAGRRPARRGAGRPTAPVPRGGARELLLLAGASARDACRQRRVRRKLARAVLFWLASLIFADVSRGAQCLHESATRAERASLVAGVSEALRDMPPGARAAVTPPRRSSHRRARCVCAAFSLCTRRGCAAQDHSPTRAAASVPRSTHSRTTSSWPRLRTPLSLVRTRVGCAQRVCAMGACLCRCCHQKYCTAFGFAECVGVVRAWLCVAD